MATAAEDWLEAGLEVSWEGGTHALRERLAEGQRRARLSPRQIGFTTIAGKRVKILAHGDQLGDESGPFFDWQIVFNGIGMLITKDRRRSKVWVRIEGKTCLRRGALACWTEVKEFIHQLGGYIVLEKISRVDVCLDIPQQSTKPFLQAFRDRRFVSRGRVTNPGLTSTVYLGTKPIELRIYDKRTQARASADLPVLVTKRWGGHLPKAATRVEFAVRRVALKRLGMGSVAQYFAARATVVKYLTTDWVRFVESRPKLGNERHAKVLKEWKFVQQEFQKWAGQPPPSKPIPIPPELGDGSHLRKQIIGVAISLAISLRKKLTDPGVLAAFIAKEIRESVTETFLAERFEEKIANRITSGVCSEGDVPVNVPAKKSLKAPYKPCASASTKGPYKPNKLCGTIATPTQKLSSKPPWKTLPSGPRKAPYKSNQQITAS